MLYWAEGRRGRNTVALSNADPEVLRFFVAFLMAYFAVPREKFRVWCNLFADHGDRQREIERSGSICSSFRGRAGAAGLSYESLSDACFPLLECSISATSEVG
jgi:hypothetical protein